MWVAGRGSGPAPGDMTMTWWVAGRGSGPAPGDMTMTCAAGRDQVMRWRTVAETNSLTTTTASTAISMTATSRHRNWLIEE